MKKISYLFIAFSFMFVINLTNVNAKFYLKDQDKYYDWFSYDFLSEYSLLFTDDNLINIRSYLKNFDKNVFDIKSCYYMPKVSSENNLNIYCYSTFLESSGFQNPHLFVQPNVSLPGLIITYDYSEFTYSLSTSLSTPIILTIDFNYYNINRLGVYLYSSQDLIYSEIEMSNRFGEFYIEDEIYDSMDSNLKKYYNFKNYLVIDNPIYSLINLRLGDYTGPVTSADLTINYYFDNVLDDSMTITKKYNVGEHVVLDSLEDVIEDIYFLDKTQVYQTTISSTDTNVINVYYNTIDVNYNVNVYLDDIYYQGHSFVGTGKVGSEVILEDLLETINVYTLDNREYKLLLSENPQTNYINVYYYSDNYDTKYQDIDTSGKFYISFNWVYIKELFDLNGNYTQTEQFVIVYVVNFLFYAVLLLFSYFGIRMLGKLWSFFRMF